MSLVFGDESGWGGCVWHSGDVFPEEPLSNKHISVYVSENGLPKGQQLCHISFFTNCDVSRVFGSKSVDFCPDAPSLQMAALMDKNSFTLDFQILWCESSLWG